MKYNMPRLLRMQEMTSGYCGSGSSATSGSLMSSFQFCQDGGNADSAPGASGFACVTGGGPLGANAEHCYSGSTATYSGYAGNCQDGSAAGSANTAGACTDGLDVG